MHARSLLVAAALLLGGTASAAPVHMRPYFAKDKSEVVLVWDEATGISKGWYYDKADKAFKPSDAAYQLPADPGFKSNVMMAPYLGPDGSEVVLVWDKKSGKSVSWYFDEADKKFKKSDPNYQLPAQKGAEVMMAPFLAKDGSEVVLVWDAATGKSVNWYFDKADDKFKPSDAKWQLPADVGVKGRVMLKPYVAKDGSEVVQAWSVTDGKSVNWYMDEAEGRYKRSDAGYQLPANPGVAKDVHMFPYHVADGSEVMLVWSASTGVSVNWYYDEAKKAFARSTPDYQLPANPIKAKQTMMFAYTDTEKSEVILVWDMATGASRGFYFDESAKKMAVAAPGYQLPASPLR